MVFAFGIDLPVIEIMLIVSLLFVVGICFMIWQIVQMKHHIDILENTTLEIRKYEEEDEKRLLRFDEDVNKLESDEAEFFLAKVLPSAMKMENYVASLLINGSSPEDVMNKLVASKVQREFAVQIVGTVGMYLKYYGKTSQKQLEQHAKVADNLNAK